MKEAIRNEILRIADLRLILIWRDSNRGEYRFGTEAAPDKLLDIVGIEYERGGKIWRAFSFRCGQALTFFLNREEIRWIASYSKALIRFDPYHKWLEKRLGYYFIDRGIIAGKYGDPITVKVRGLLESCGIRLKTNNPLKTIKRINKGCKLLQEIGVCDIIPDLEELYWKNKGKLQPWLEEVITVKLSDHIWRLNSPALPPPQLTICQ
jgi:hypothetical protein